MATFPIGGTATLGERDCHSCGGSGRKTRKGVDCTRDDMLRKRARRGDFHGHFKRCPDCGGKGYYFVECNEPCPHCEGTGREAEDLYDSFHLPEDMPVEVVVTNRELTRVESLLGCALGSCVDYGRAYSGLMSEASHEEVVAHLTEKVHESKHQAVHFCCKDTGRVADAVVVVVSKGGYSSLPKYVLDDGRVAYAARTVNESDLQDLATDPDDAVLLHAGKWEGFWSAAKQLGVA